MKRNAQGRVDLSLGGLASSPPTSQPEQTNRESVKSGAVTTPGGSSKPEQVGTQSKSQGAAPLEGQPFKGLDPFTLELIGKNPLVPKIKPKPKAEGQKLEAPAPAPQPEPKPGMPLDGMLLMVGAALASGVGAMALSGGKKASTPPTPSPAAPRPVAPAPSCPIYAVPSR